MLSDIFNKIGKNPVIRDSGFFSSYDPTGIHRNVMYLATDQGKMYFNGKPYGGSDLTSSPDLPVLQIDCAKVNIPQVDIPSNTWYLDNELIANTNIENFFDKEYLKSLYEACVSIGSGLIRIEYLNYNDPLLTYYTLGLLDIIELTDEYGGGVIILLNTINFFIYEGLILQILKNSEELSGSICTMVHENIKPVFNINKVDSDPFINFSNEATSGEIILNSNIILEDYGYNHSKNTPVFIYIKDNERNSDKNVGPLYFYTVDEGDINKWGYQGVISLHNTKKGSIYLAYVLLVVDRTPIENSGFTNGVGYNATYMIYPLQRIVGTD